MSSVAHSRASARSSSNAKGQHRRGPVVAITAVIILVLLAVVGVFIANSSSASSPGAAGGTGQYPFQIGHPAPGEQAPAFKLQSTDGTVVDSSTLKGQNVLLFFQEGIVCEPCWTQIKDIQSQWSSFQGLGVDRLVTVTADPITALKVKVADERITTAVLSDAGAAVSRTYQTTSYGMHPGTNGHSFVLVGPDGLVRWRADYGGPPRFSMYIPISNLLADMRAGPNPTS